MRCSSVEWIARNESALRWCHRGVGKETEETVGFPELTAQFSVCKTAVKDSSEACAIACQNYAIYSVFPSGMTSHSKIAQINWECIGRLKWKKFVLLGIRRLQVVYCVTNYTRCTVVFFSSKSHKVLRYARNCNLLCTHKKHVALSDPSFTNLTNIIHTLTIICISDLLYTVPPKLYKVKKKYLRS